MKRKLTLLILLATLFTALIPEATKAEPVNDTSSSTIAKLTQEQENNLQSEGSAHSSSSEEGHGEEHSSHSAPPWLVVPFVALLLMIAIGPLFFENFWHKNYPVIAMLLAAVVVSYYIFILGNMHEPVHALAEYVQFIALLSSLFIASGGILIKVNRKSTPATNVMILLVGAVIANLIGTTGASMLLIRPFIRLNNHRIQPYHVVFFIFIISNIGGALTPIGDPPLFLGFLKGVPFFWTMKHNITMWIFAVVVLLGVFYFLDKKNQKGKMEEETEELDNKVSIIGQKNFLWLAIVIASVFIDPNVFSWVPGITYDGAEFSYIREAVMFSVAFLSFRFASKKAHEGNEFSFEPIREVAFIFIGIFGTMMPALELVGDFAKSDTGSQLITHNTLYWGTGVLSGFLDNAPTYINFLTAAMAAQGADIGVPAEVSTFAQGEFKDSILDLNAIAIAAVFFGALTYIGNGPNFMVKSIAEQTGIRMPSFFGYVIRFSIPILIPILIIVWLIFFAFSPV